MTQIEELLKNSLKDVPESRVKEAMLYSLCAPGKRLRPKMLYAVTKGYGVSEEKADNFAIAIEMIHTYSLIHDDLPAMDNDDLRRGRATCHKQFDEATAILAGDGLLTQAFLAASQSSCDFETIQKAIGILSLHSGPSGMVYGQCLDIQAENQSTSWEELKTIHRHKTGDLFTAPLLIGATIAKRSPQELETWQTIGYELGLAFQIQDDILDHTKSSQELGKSNSDITNHKTTSVSLLGVEEAKTMMQELYNRCENEIKNLKGFESDALMNLVQEISLRSK